MRHFILGCDLAKTDLLKLLARVAKGDIVTITKHGVLVAQLVPISLPSKPDAGKVIENLIAYSKQRRRTFGKGTHRDLINEGRRN
jgi:prevent-host-death family protein